MNQNRLLLILLATLVVGGAGIFALTDTGAAMLGLAKSAPQADSPTVATTPLDDATGRPASTKDAPADAAAAQPLDDIPARDPADPGRQAGTKPDPKQPAGSPTGSSPAAQPGSTAPGGTTPAQPAQPRQLTPREREEEARRTTGRAALAEKLGRSPTGGGNAASLAKSPEQEKWAEQWYAEGFNPPEMTPTPVHGKIMSQEAREGLAKATVGLISFFPIDGVAGGPLLPVITEFTTDEQGYFGGDIPASKLAPLNYPPVAISITYETYRVVAAMPIETLFVGKQNELGIFWAPETPYVLKADARQFDGNLTVVSSGELNPQRWHNAKRTATLAYFPAFNVAATDPNAGQTGPAAGFAEVIGTWDVKDTPYISLFGNGQLEQTRRPTKSTLASSSSAPGTAPAPFDVLVFENDALTPISGQVVNSEGAAIANAVVTTVGDMLSVNVVTDSAGWFLFEDPPEKTSALKCVHNDYVETLRAPVVPGDSDVQIVMAVTRPRIRMLVTDKLTQVPITELSIKVIGLYPHGKDAGKPMPEAFAQLTSADGHFVLEWEFAVKSITLEKLGYFPRTILDPSSAVEEISVELTPGRKLDINPKSYTAAETPERWFPDADPNQGIYTAWSHHWIEWAVDFGDAPEAGEEGGSFDMVLGCTNRGIVDNEYQFKVDVYVDGVKKGELTIMADSLNERTARISLGALSGPHTIRLIWTNDKWIPDQLDANIRYGSLKFLEQP